VQEKEGSKDEVRSPAMVLPHLPFGQDDLQKEEDSFPLKEEASCGRGAVSLREEQGSFFKLRETSPSARNL